MRTSMISIGLVLAAALLAGCAPLAMRTSGDFAPDRLAELSRTTENPFTNYENVWAATKSVMEKNYQLGAINKDRGTIKSHPKRSYSTYMTLKTQAFATIKYEDGLFIPEVKIVVFTDLSSEDAFSSEPSPRRWRQMLQSQDRAMELEEDIRRLLLRLPEPGKAKPGRRVPAEGKKGTKKA